MSRGDNQLPSICFDDDCQVRVLDKENITHTQELEQESNQFATKLEEFHAIVKGVLEVMEGQAKRIEREKLKAIGQRNRVDSEVENRNRQKQMLELLIKEKKTELERYNLQFQSLAKIADEQQLLMDKLSNNEA
ncbi:Intraflagellar Transport Protein 20 [Phytophthora infestans T30-4]|uniref:Intraflagellar Transport Protein 20 n=2 Tax=Phytophthora infestans TaxID=4787 RepID=D0N6V9_PHYIT|nr:Intraflagellar Transport Protein 20 [Phytophthora infestans T30-4]EEY53308.1 Intraflagellar Transport Protein 20 [Phytophthora infestans T30-4]KAF4034535.1 Intraflagellar transport complex B [Phytophthora infestans]KAF4141629.1 Intraflagellar transport complex B subunit 20 [Phytophthora infestans]|eukprot:XP_002904926.1 Intraflagellar Transport Protein 20 [Phytophthora infestans T30-4]